MARYQPVIGFRAAFTRATVPRSKAVQNDLGGETQVQASG
jgi:hypothetical protein